MNIQDILSSHINLLVDKLSQVQDFPEDFFPLSVYIEEEGENNYPVYNRYELLKVFPDGSCLLRSTHGKGEAERHLSEINVDWLVSVWTHYENLIAAENAKELAAFIFPASRFNRYSKDEEIIRDYENMDQEFPEVEKLTPDELAAKLNDDGYIGDDYYIRFIKC